MSLQHAILAAALALKTMEMKMVSNLAAVLFAFLTLAVVVFQLALVSGAPWGEFTLGGKYPGKLPRPIRIVSIFSAILLIAFAAIVLARAGIAFKSIRESSHWMVWGVIGYCVVGTVLNLKTPSRRERALWSPVVMLMLLSSLIVGAS
ncbi:hypothetical protein [Massilia eurypsychrophila]|jgi:hypothetical protein|nr:hypothetical protein [Massilia eurypsychrophila]